MADTIGSLMSGDGVPPPGTPPPRPSSGKATAAMVLGILGLVLFPVICSALAIIFGSLAMRQTSRDPELDGRGQAIAGLVMGIVGFLVAVLVLAAVATE